MNLLLFCVGEKGGRLYAGKFFMNWLLRKKDCPSLQCGQSGIAAGRGWRLRKLTPNGRGLSPGAQWQQAWWTEGPGHVGRRVRSRGSSAPTGSSHQLAQGGDIECSAATFPRREEGMGSLLPSSALQHTPWRHPLQWGIRCSDRRPHVPSGLTSSAHW